ncbi:MAG: hypothetical protein KDE35_11515 [Geminicoccaceae bacterium]|nr:hypothetical protein [Geminicoccaceae bacterium]
MAHLRDDFPSLEFTCRDVAYGWINDDFCQRWGDRTLVDDDDVLERSDDHRRDRLRNGFEAKAHEACSFLPFPRRPARTFETDHREPIGPDVIVAVHADDVFPFIPSRRVLIGRGTAHPAERDAGRSGPDLAGSGEDGAPDDGT